MQRMYKYGLLDPAQNKLDYVLALTPQDFVQRRLQIPVFKLGLPTSIHHARGPIKQCHIRRGAFLKALGQTNAATELTARAC